MFHSTTSSQSSNHHRVSRSNSVSSSSVVTVQRAASLTGSRPPDIPLRSQSPNQANTGGTKLAKVALSIENNRSASAGHSRPNSVTGIKEGVGNLNRWSQSTASSRSSVGHNRKNSFTRRLSFGGSGSIGSLAGFAASQSPQSRNVLSKPRLSPGSSPSRHSSKAPPAAAPSTILPPLMTLPSLTIVTNDDDSPSTIASTTPATAELLPTPTDYFGNKWTGPSPPRRRPSVQRTITAPSPLAGPSSSSRKAMSSGFDIHPPSASSDSALSPPNKAPPKPKYRDYDRTTHVSHSRNREAPGKGSGSTEAESSASSLRSNKEGRKRKHKTPSQKAMLSKALQKAHTAVLLDNAQNFEGAMEAYRDACALLQQVMIKSSGEDDRKKLEAIRSTYTNRINELMNLDITYQNAGGKALPKRPKSNGSRDQDLSPAEDDEQGAPMFQSAMVTRTVNEDAYNKPQGDAQIRFDPGRVPVRRSLLPSAPEQTLRTAPAWQSVQNSQQRIRPRSPLKEKATKTAMNLALPVDSDCMPPPLSPRRPLSPKPPDSQPASAISSTPTIASAQQGQITRHSRDDSNGSTSWLDTIDESDGSSASSVHSRTSSIGLRRKRIRAVSGATQAEFDAALDAAVEAAYNDGFEPVNEGNEQPAEPCAAGDIVSNARRNVEKAKQRVREAETEAANISSRNVESGGMHRGGTGRDRSDSIDLEYGDDEAEEEERMLEEMTKGYVMDDFEFDMQSKSALPRQSDSSGFSGRTWGSSIGSNPTTAGTSLSTVAEAMVLPSLATQLQSQLPPPAHPPPSSALPTPPGAVPMASLQALSAAASSRPPSSSISHSQGVRDRRLSGQNAKQLKIETKSKLSSASQGLRTQPSLVPPAIVSGQEFNETRDPVPLVTQTQSTLGGTFMQDTTLATTQALNRQISSTFVGSSPADTVPSESPATPALTKVTSYESDESAPPMPSSPARLLRKVATGPGNLRKNFSSSSLKNRSLSVSTPDMSDISPNTPISSTFAMVGPPRKGPNSVIPALPTPTGGSFALNGLPTGGVYLFDTDIHSPRSPGSPNPLAVNPPLPLEPCPESSLLRPFWVLRCLYQTLAHPRGGYLSTKLFVPRDVWRVKNVKLKGLEEKVANCDLLTAALLKLSKVNTLDADAVLEEMQSLESVLDHVQVTLSKKLGSDVGAQVPSSLFKGGNTAEEAGSHLDSLTSKSSNVAGRSYLTSWRDKLRSKNSGAGPPNVVVSANSKDGLKEALGMSSLPMTSLNNFRSAKRDVSQVQCTGPNANYMGALVRLSDAAQVLDQIARQVEDPGLKHSSQTHVGLELSMRHAAEFFAFYICRFALTDVGMMLDKFIKRGSEWVLV